ncbi:MAG: alpha/beta hydrolase [Pontiellaceae bacterium]|nr:alpha/beta hydrolase [Pontiellaceae bacterium]MBN2784570.1 alpha/beta hydrolase [Pontiellaceae bacterium]
MRTVRGFCAAVLVSGAVCVHAQETFTVILDEVFNGKINIVPELPSDGKVAAGTLLTISAAPDDGYALDSVYYSVQSMWLMFHESMTSPFQVVVNSDRHIGASFIEKAELENINVTQDVVYAKPGVKPLKYDVYAPAGAENLPCIVIIHGGGWSANTEDIMRGMARELIRDGKYVVFSMDYRWAGTRDGDAVGNTMADIIGDVFGGLAHIMEHAAEYGGDPSRIAVTGDSAGGHLSAVAGTMPDMIGEGGFGKMPGVFEFMPSYLPAGKTAAEVRAGLLKSIKAAAPSYGVFDSSRLNHYSEDPAADQSWKDAVAPRSHIPNASEREIPHYLIRGTADPLISDKMVKEYTDALVEAGQRAEYVQVGGAGHAFFDWKPDPQTRATFRKIGVYYIREMEAFFNSVFYPAR